MKKEVGKMKKVSVLIITLTMILVFATAAWGVSFGARAAGMGGAFTAVADDCSAVYWNPAGITQLKVLTITPGLGFLGEQSQIDAVIKLTGDSDPSTLFNLLDSIDSNGISIGSSLYLGVTTKFVAVNAFADMNGVIKKEELLMKTFGDYNLYGIGTLAIPVGPLAVGGNIKLVQSGYTKSVTPVLPSYDPEYIAANQGTLETLFTNPNNNYTIQADGQGLAFDVGVLFSLTDLLKIGLTGRNIVSSVEWSGSKTINSFDFVNQEPIQGTPQNFSDNQPLPSTWTVGVALRPASSTLIAADMEMSTNPVDASFNATLYHVGLEQLLLAKTTALRLGAYTTPSNEMAYSAGIGFKLGPIILDGAYTSEGLTGGYFITAGFKF
jgi:long-subunit fatty acid transport protein